MNDSYELDDEQDIWTAYHEAGHAVIAYALGARIESIQLGGEADEFLPARFGDVRINWGPVFPDSNWQLQRELISVVAGPVAEMIYREVTLLDQSHRISFSRVAEWENDLAHASRCIAKLVAKPEHHTEMLRRVFCEIERRLRDDACWAAIAAVADELLAHEQLDEDQIADAIGFWLRPC